MNRLGVFRPEPVVSPAFWPWLETLRAQQFGQGLFPLNTPVDVTQPPMETPRVAVKPPTATAGGARTQLRDPTNPRAGVSTAGTHEGPDAGAPTLPRPSPALLTSSTTDVLPSAVEATNLPNLTGEVGKVPYRTRMQQQSQMMSPPDAVSTAAVGLREPGRRAAGAAVSTQATPDAGVGPAMAGLFRQLPSTDAYREKELSVHLASASAASARIETGGVIPIPNAAPEKKKRRLFRE